jgi:hypothetical protein
MKLVLAAFLVMGLATAGVAGETEESYAGEVTASKLQLRAGPGEAYQPVVALTKGDRVIVRGTHPDSPNWLVVEIPQGFTAWVFGRFISTKGDGTGEITASRLLVRPRPTTKYHHLNGRLDKGEVVKILETKQTAEGPWVKILVPSRFPLYAHSEFLSNAGPVEEAMPKEVKDAPPAKEAVLADPQADQRFETLAAEIRPKLTSASTTAEIEPLRRAVEEFDSSGLSSTNRTRRYELLNEITRAELEAAKKELVEREKDIVERLDHRLEEIERKYRERLQQIKSEYDRTRKPRYVATGIVSHRPDLFGRHPSFRIEEGGKMRYFLIATDYDLNKFVGKRVGVTGLTDPESGTGHRTVMVKRIEILGAK